MFDYVKNEYNINPQLSIERHGSWDFVVNYDVCPYLILPSSTNDFWNTKKQKFKYNIRRDKRKILQNIGEIKFNIYDKGPELEQVLPQIFDLYRERWRLEYNSSLFKTESGQILYTKAALELAKKDNFFLATLSIGETLVSYGYCLKYNNVAYLFTHCVSIKDVYRKFSIGKIFFSFLIEYLISINIHELDFMIGSEDYKYEWTKTEKNCFKVFYRKNYKYIALFYLDIILFKIRNLLRGIKSLRKMIKCYYRIKNNFIHLF